MLELQRSLHEEVARGLRGDTWIVVEHDPVVTLGRSAKRSSLLVSESEMARRGIDVVEVERGGDATYHGPGQLVVYPIVRLERFREVVPLVSALENATIEMLATFGIAGSVRREHRGVYVGAAAICAVGIAVKRMTSLHGLALNVSTELDYDRLIAPCGLPEFGITSMERELGRRIDPAVAREALLASLATAFDVRLEDAPAPAPAPAPASSARIG
ncbi:MAG: lipoyl(octanoyl) transferase LipB [Candidatus Eremiobacteraeota bacterium]|nr:lipoyl(octanoyl) transferase LipB [Candidatus Eremiobacteraeota bacterium]